MGRSRPVGSLQRAVSTRVPHEHVGTLKCPSRGIRCDRRSARVGSAEGREGLAVHARSRFTTASISGAGAKRYLPGSVTRFIAEYRVLPSRSEIR